MKLVTVQSDFKRDPRGQIVDSVWSTRVQFKLPAVASDDLEAVAWHPLRYALGMTLAFDHNNSLQRFATIEGFLS